jgi:hypothetical protein
MFESLKQFLEDFVPKKRHAKFQAGWCPFIHPLVNKLKFRSLIILRAKWFFGKLHRSRLGVRKIIVVCSVKLR